MPPKPRQPEGERKFDSSSALGTLQAQLSREVLKHTATIRVTDGNKNRLKSMLESRDAGRAGEIAEIFNTDTNFTAVRNEPGITADDVRRLGKFIWGVNGQEKAAVSETERVEVKAESLPPTTLPEEKPTAEAVAAEESASQEMDPIQQMLLGLDEAVKELDQPVVMDVESMPGLTQLAELARQVEASTPPAHLPEEIVVEEKSPVAVQSPVEEVQEMAVAPVVARRREVQTVRERVKEPVQEFERAEQTREQEQPVGRHTDLIPFYAPEPAGWMGMVRRLRPVAVTPAAEFQPNPNAIFRGEFAKTVEQFKNGKKDMVAVLGVYDRETDTFTDVTEPTVINATTDFYVKNAAEKYPLLDPMRAVSVFKEMQADRVPNYAVWLGDPNDKIRHFMVYRFLDNAVQDGVQYKEGSYLEALQDAKKTFREDPLEFLVQSMMELGNFTGIMGAYQELGVALSSGDADAITKAEEKIADVHQGIFEMTDLQRRAVATKRLLERTTDAETVLHQILKERRQLQEILARGRKIEAGGTRVKDEPVPVGYLNQFKRLSLKRIEELLKREIAEYPAALEASVHQANALLKLIYDFAPDDDQITNPDYVADITALQTFCDNPTYESLAEAERVAAGWSSQMRVQYEKYYLEVGRAARFEVYRKKLNIKGLDEKEIDIVDEALEQVEDRLFKMFEDLVLKKLQSKDPDQRKGAFDAFTNWIEAQTTVQTTAEAGVDIILPYVQEAVSLAAAEYELYIQALRKRTKGAEKHLQNFNRLQEQGIIPKVEGEEAVLFTTDDLSDDEFAFRDEILRDHLMRVLTENKFGASKLLKGLQGWINANSQGADDLLEFGRMLGRSSDLDKNKRSRDNSGDNTLFYLMQAHDKAEEATKDGRLAMAGDNNAKNQAWRALRDAHAEVLPYFIEMADWRDGKRDEASTVAIVGDTAKILNREIDQTKLVVEREVAAALA